MAFSGFLQIEGITGESSDDAHADWIEFEKFHHEVMMPGGSDISGSGGLAGGKADVGDIKITKLYDKSTPAICEFSYSAKEVPTITIELCDAQAGTQFTYMKYTLENCIISGYTQIGDTKGDHNRPLEEISLRFARIKFEYTPRKDDGSADAATTGGWDRGKNIVYA